ncbi:MAG: hypothetical protein HC841_08920 [Verrucomicrobiae bacterium]|nr:hypothetical protein [Verrucomicrobiae bacterium]
MNASIGPSCLAALAVAASCLPPVARADDFQGSTHKVPYDEEIIAYGQRAADGPVERLQRRIGSGELTLRYDEQFGWLPAIMEALDVPKASQMLVFSKTSLQRQHITPDNPRAIYFNDDVYLGYIPGAPVMEVSAVDPKLGGVFYTVPQGRMERPRFERSDDCTSCHGAAKTLGVPGHFVRSVATDPTGEIDQRTEFSYINHRTPLAERWGGWYVTGTHGDQPHRGNIIGFDAWENFGREPAKFANLDDLSPFFDQSKHLARGSDIVALMVLEHQGHMHNYITRLAYETEIMMKTYGHIRYLRMQVAGFLRFLLLTEETPLTAPVAGNPEFVKAFEARGPRDAKGRSLRELDLRTRLFKHPCSYLIHSEAFAAMPAVMREHLLIRLHDILTGRDDSEDFAMLTKADRRNLLEILTDTLPALPDCWRQESTTAGVVIAPLNTPSTPTAPAQP